MSVGKDITKDMNVVIASIIESNILRNMHGEVIQRLSSLEIAKDILSHPRIGVIAEDQSLPDLRSRYRGLWWMAQQDMLKANFKRIEEQA